MRFNLKARLALLGKKSVDVIDELRKYGIYTDPSHFSTAISGRSSAPKMELIASKADEIVTKWERGEK